MCVCVRNADIGAQTVGHQGWNLAWRTTSTPGGYLVPLIISKVPPNPLGLRVHTAQTVFFANFRRANKCWASLKMAVSLPRLDSRLHPSVWQKVQVHRRCSLAVLTENFQGFMKEAFSVFGCCSGFGICCGLWKFTDWSRVPLLIKNKTIS